MSCRCAGVGDGCPGGGGEPTPGGSCQLLTPRSSAVTYPLELFLRDTGVQWVRRVGAEEFRDGLTGAPLRWTGVRFASDPADAPQPTPPPSAGSGDLELQITTVHPAEASLELGASTATAVRALTGTDPLGWGTAEPVCQRWSPRALTQHCRGRAPADTQLVVLGVDVVGQILVERTENGVQEQVRLAGPPAGLVAAAVVEALVAELAGMVWSMLVAVNPGVRGGMRQAATSPCQRSSTDRHRAQRGGAPHVVLTVRHWRNSVEADPADPSRQCAGRMPAASSGLTSTCSVSRWPSRYFSKYSVGTQVS